MGTRRWPRYTADDTPKLPFSTAEDRLPQRASEPPDLAPLQAAFRELHGRRLHGFSLLLTLGDADRAAALAGEALAAGADRASELRHPERAAAWLRARVVRHAARVARKTRRRRDLSDLAVDEPTLAALSTLDQASRAALVADVVEGFDRRDVGTIVGRDGRDLARLLDRSIARYVVAYGGALGLSTAQGPTVDRVHAAARRAMA